MFSFCLFVVELAATLVVDERFEIVANRLDDHAVLLAHLLLLVKTLELVWIRNK